MIYRIFRGNS